MKDDELLKLVALDLHAALAGMSDGVTTTTTGSPTCRSPSGGGRRRASSPSSRRRASRSRRWSSTAARSPRRSGARPGATTSSATATIANRLPRGRTYVRNGSVVDLQIAPGAVTALVSGSELYDDRRSTIARGPEGALAGDLPRLRGRDRFAGRAAAGPLVQGRHGRASAGRSTGLFPVAEGDHVLVQLPGLGVDVQARRGGALRHRRAAGRTARAAVRAAQGEPARISSPKAGTSLPRTRKGAAGRRRSSTPGICRRSSGSRWPRGRRRRPRLVPNGRAPSLPLQRVVHVDPRRPPSLRAIARRGEGLQRLIENHAYWSLIPMLTRDRRVRVALVGGPMYDPLYDAIPRFEQDFGLSVEVVVQVPHPELNAWVQEAFTSGDADIDLLSTHTKVRAVAGAVAVASRRRPRTRARGRPPPAAAGVVADRRPTSPGTAQHRRSASARL